MKLFLKLLSIIILLGSFLNSCSSNSSGPNPGPTPKKQKAIAFPGAEGFGAKTTTGGRGGNVIYVTNLNDSGQGSLRSAISTAGARYILFKVSGTIKLKSDLKITNGNVTIAGQTAPGGGITIRNYTTKIEANNVIIRFMRFRMGDTADHEGDALDANGGVKNVVVDHCSMSWSTDETGSFYEDKNLTVQWCVIAESLNNSIHHKGVHGYGGIWGGKPATFHHNLLADHNSRNPRFSGSSTVPNSQEELTDFRNNVIYNWYTNSTYGGEAPGRFNMVNNYYKYGPATKDSKLYRIIEPYKPYGSFYIHGNYVYGSSTITNNNWAGNGNGGVHCKGGPCPDSTLRHKKPFNYKIKKTQSAQNAYKSVLNYAGDSKVRDAIDKQVIKGVRNDTAYAEGPKTQRVGIIDSQTNVGGWPTLKKGTPPKDTDGDGMPDGWEKKKGLNPNKSNPNGHDLNTGYTNLEVYLNSLVSNIMNNEE